MHSLVLYSRQIVHLFRQFLRCKNLIFPRLLVFSVNCWNEKLLRGKRLNFNVFWDTLRNVFFLNTRTISNLDFICVSWYLSRKLINVDGWKYPWDLDMFLFYMSTLLTLFLCTVELGLISPGRENKIKFPIHYKHVHCTFRTSFNM